jgi:hypothetical protein
VRICRKGKTKDKNQEIESMSKTKLFASVAVPVSKISKDWDDLWDNAEEETKESFVSPELYFGKTAQDKFWNMFKYPMIFL